MSTPRNPHPENSSPAIDLDLEARIVRAELAVIARDERIRRRASALFHRVRHDTLRHAGGGLAVGVGTVALAWWLNHRRPAPPNARAAAAAAETPSNGEHVARDAAFSLAALLPVIWPMLPYGLRRHLTPNSAGNLITLVTPLVARVFRRKPRTSAF